MASPESTQPPPPPPWLPLETKDCSQGLCSPFCPQWCYILFPPPPPFSFDPENVDSSSTAPTFPPLVIAIIGILSCAFLLVGYYTVVSKFCGGASFIRGCRSRRGTAPPGGSESDDEDPGMQARRRRHDQEWQHLPPAVGLDDALISKITVCRYKRGDGPVGGCTDCSVCLGEFREDESLRLLPKCGHAFHVRCIDAWLKSHSNCPLCRASVVVLASPAPPQLPAPARPVSSETSDETVVVVVGESTEEGEGTGSENGGEDAMEEAVDDDETMVGGSSSRRSDEEGEHSKQGSGSSTGRFCLTRQGRGKNSVLPV